MNEPNRRKINILLTLVCLFVAAVMLVTAGLAWFSGFSAREEGTTTVVVQEPPILYILDSDATDVTQLSLRGLKIGETKKLVFCISSVYPVENDSLGLQGSFSLEVINTNNMAATYTLYAAAIEQQQTAGSLEYVSQAGQTHYFTQGDEISGENITAQGNTNAYGTPYTDVQLKNQATYMKYSPEVLDATNPNYNLQFLPSAGRNGMYNTLNCRYFILEITWGDTSNVDAKETDMVYIIAKGGYLKQGA